MPYVKQERRSDLNKVVIAMTEASVKADGDLNYILFKYFLNNIPLNYNSVKNYIGELNETIAEIRRRVLSKYEDEKILSNGDVI